MINGTLFALCWNTVWIFLFLVIEISSFAPTISSQNHPIRHFNNDFSWHLYGKRKQNRFNSKQPLKQLKLRPILQERLQSQVQIHADTGGTGTDHHHDHVVTVLMVDANNVRGVDGFQLTTHDLIRSLASWRRSMLSSILPISPTGEPSSASYSHICSLSILCMIDHGGQPNAFPLDEENGITLVFAGPNRTADDVMVEDCQWLVAEGQRRRWDLDIFVATSDRELRSRCLLTNKDTNTNHPYDDASVSSHRPIATARSKDKKESVQVYESRQLSNLLKTHWKEQVMVAPPLTTTNETTNTDQSEILDALWNIESTLRSSPSKVMNRRQRRHAQTSEPNEWNVRPLGATNFPESTWQRVLIAERLRRIVLQRQAQSKSTTTSSTVAVQSSIDADATDISFFLSRYQARHNTLSDSSPVDIFEDRRIRQDKYAQIALSRFLDEESKLIHPILLPAK